MFDNSKLWSYLFKDLSVRNKLHMSFFWIGFVLVCLPVIVALHQHSSSRDGLYIDFAGRTRYLSQKIYSEANMATDPNPETRALAKKHLKESINRLSSIYSSFETGGKLIDSERDTISLSAAKDESIVVPLKKAQEIFNKNLGALNTLVNDDNSVAISNEELAAQKELKEWALNEQLLMANQELVSAFYKQGQLHRNQFYVLFLGIAVIALIIVVFNFLLIQNYVVKPIDVIAKAANAIEEGDSHTKIEHNINDELGMIIHSINALANNLREAAEFTVKIGKGEFNADFNVKMGKNTSEEHNLGTALLNMRDRLMKVAEEDKKRNWATEGFAMFGDILRKDNDNIGLLSDNIISHLVKYLKANQGSLFIVNEESKEEAFLEMKACYAWNKKKFIERKIELGEGIVGQVWQEGDTVLLTEIPDNYITITSGLGEANPNCILVVPLKVNEQIFGVIELASFKRFEAHEIDFTTKLGESIASTISGVKGNERTRKLLTDSQQLTESLKTQEEETRQNMEELNATQDEMRRKEEEIARREEEIRGQIEVLERMRREKI